MHTRVWLAFWLVLSGGAQAASPVVPEKSSVRLKVATMPWPPFRMASATGQLIGLDIDLLNELERRTGLTFQLQSMPWARGLEGLRQGRVDLMTGLALTPERAEFVDYLQPAYHACAPRFYGRPELQGRVTTYAGLQGLRIGYVLQSAYFQPFDGDQQLNKQGVNSEAQLLEMLQIGRIDLLVGTDCQVDYDRRDPRLATRMQKMSYVPPSHTPLYIGFSRSSPHQEQREALQTALRQLLDEGWLQRQGRLYWGQR